jgi:hypothetical protein
MERAFGTEQARYQGSIEPRSLLELALAHSLAGLVRGAFDVPARSNTACLKSGENSARTPAGPARALMRGPSRGQRGAALTSRHQLPYALMYEDNLDP